MRRIFEFVNWFRDVLPVYSIALSTRQTVVSKRVLHLRVQKLLPPTPEIQRGRRKMLCFRRNLLILVCMLVASPALLCAQNGDPRNSQLDVHLDPHKVLGYESCAKCHASEVEVWKKTPHSKTFRTLHRNPAAREIANKLGISSFKTDSECIKCHYTMKDHEGRLDAISGISCESCHGAAQDWLEVHNDYGPGTTKASESTQHRLERLRNSIAGGMRNPVNVYMVAQSCLRCHTVPSEKLVNVGGHTAGSLDFEIVSWSQGSLRHNFVRSDGTTNDPSDRNRLRKLFVSGFIAEVEFSLRAVAGATEKADFAVTSAKRAAKAAKKLAQVQKLTGNELLKEVIVVFEGVSLKLNNHEELTDAANKIAALGVRFAAVTTGQELAAIDKYIPDESKWR